jgi:hypothetical protein
VVLLAAGAADRAAVSWWAALAVGSFVVQTNISTLPLVVAVLALAGVVVLATARHDRHRRAARHRDARRRRTRWTWILGGGAAGLTVVMWIPPVVQEVTGTPGNLALIADFFTAHHPGQPVGTAVWATVAVLGSFVLGPTEVMTTTFSGAPAHAAAVALVTVVVLAGALLAAAVGVRGRQRFGAALGGLTVVGAVVVAVSVTRIPGFLSGYLVIWAVSLAATGLLAVGTLPVPAPGRSTVARAGLAVVAVGLAAVAVATVVTVPPLSRVSDPQVAALVRLVVPHLRAGGTVTVTDADAGAPDDVLLDLERYIGLVNQLDARGYRPRVSPFWRAQFGPRLVDGTVVRPEVVLSTWTPDAPSAAGYLGRVGDVSVVLHPPAAGT